MMSIYRQAKVFIQGRIAGILAETENGYQFAYDRTYLESKNPLAVSLTLPLTQTPYEQKTLFGCLGQWKHHLVADDWREKPPQDAIFPEGVGDDGPSPPFDGQLRR